MAPSTLLRFIQILPSVPSSGKFILKDLPGSGGRIDLLCRDLAACFDWGPEEWPVDRIELTALIEDQVALTIRNPESGVPKGEVAWAKLVQEALHGDPPSFIHVERMNLDDLLTKMLNQKNSHLYVLHEEGVPLESVEMPIEGFQNSFMLGDHRGFDSQTEERIDRYGLKRLSLGRRSYLSSHCIAVIISEFERLIVNARNE
ncbi:MAG: hypothetical protein ACP6KW_01730 [Candidatus Thorarchaeota archaeon]